ncbi:ABC transporter-associated protein EcsC [Lottiidibacillus patelloidae]|uniref:ABC transporter-associated protein EcsC n=1 Tax=Lottiidibacillus patelloidae TaxID=2670334 RepID=A0A263BYC3_9BACI|nr:EcsC family protein [Lottiidibacillus patelloidae]OZM58156.1 ABC transporter-associated protein EcsC [Lottiidibacillus patelloidae]
MNRYELHAKDELNRWKRKHFYKTSRRKMFARNIQQKINKKVPEKVHKLITSAIKGMVEATISGTSYMTKIDVTHVQTLEERENFVHERLRFYRKLAVAEGAGTGAGGIFLGIADFPLLLSIKMKFLMECSTIYGFSNKEKQERIFLLYVFQTAFSSDEHKRVMIEKISQWQEINHVLENNDWRKLQQEYRDYIDLIKMFQLLPGFGAIVGAYANNQLLEELGETAINCFRLRILHGNEKTD